MADRTSAQLFGKIFNLLASDKPLDDRPSLALQFWKMMDSGDYDFSPYQMDCDRALKKLGLLRELEEEDEDGETFQYGPPPKMKKRKLTI